MEPLQIGSQVLNQAAILAAQRLHVNPETLRPLLTETLKLNIMSQCNQQLEAISRLNQQHNLTPETILQHVTDVMVNLFSQELKSKMAVPAQNLYPNFQQPMGMQPMQNFQQPMMGYPQPMMGYPQQQPMMGYPQQQLQLQQLAQQQQLAQLAQQNQLLMQQLAQQQTPTQQTPTNFAGSPSNVIANQTANYPKLATTTPAQPVMPPNEPSAAPVEEPKVTYHVPKRLENSDDQLSDDELTVIWHQDQNFQSELITVFTGESKRPTNNLFQLLGLLQAELPLTGKHFIHLKYHPYLILDASEEQCQEIAENVQDKLKSCSKFTTKDYNDLMTIFSELVSKAMTELQQAILRQLRIAVLSGMELNNYPEIYNRYQQLPLKGRELFESWSDLKRCVTFSSQNKFETLQELNEWSDYISKLILYALRSIFGDDLDITTSKTNERRCRLDLPAQHLVYSNLTLFRPTTRIATGCVTINKAQYQEFQADTCYYLCYELAKMLAAPEPVQYYLPLKDTVFSQGWLCNATERLRLVPDFYCN